MVGFFLNVAALESDYLYSCPIDVLFTSLQDEFAILTT